MINIDDIVKIREIHARAATLKDPLVDFVMNGEPGQKEIDQIQASNLQCLFDAARKYKVRYIFIGKGEICGCENVRDSGGTWPAMWSIAKEIGFPASCGNSDQYQCKDSEIAFPGDSYGGWDLEENRKLTIGETKEKGFKEVLPIFRRSI